jgi:hypothetical protein
VRLSVRKTAELSHVSGCGGPWSAYSAPPNPIAHIPQAGLIDDVIRGDGGSDYTTPPALVRQLEDLGFVDRLTGGILNTGREF